jgi:hypothetical protein
MPSSTVICEHNRTSFQVRIIFQRWSSGDSVHKPTSRVHIGFMGPRYNKLDIHTSVIGMVGHIHARYLAKDEYIIYVCDYLTYWALVQDFSKLLPIYYYMVDASPTPSWDRMSNY